MIYEKAKSVVLTLLVLLSLFLTWRLWAFQPDYDLLSHNEVDYIKNEPLNEVKLLADVIYPEAFIFHYGGRQTIASLDETIAKELYKELLNSKVDEFRIFDGTHSLDCQNCIEIILPSRLSYDVIMNLFQMEDVPNYSLKEIERFIVFANDETETVYLRFVSNNENKEIEAVTSLSYNNFVNNYLEKGKQFSRAVYFETPNGKKIYVPKEQVVVLKRSYTIYPLSIEFFNNLLFNDPLSVRLFRQHDGDEMYTDGNRMIHLTNSRNIMNYVNPIYTEYEEKSQRHIVISGYDFINGHGGWTDEYQLSDWTSNSLNDEVNFRMAVKGIPVFLMDGEDVLKLSVTRRGNQISRYERPLFELDSEPIDANQEVVLPSGEEVLWHLQSQKELQPALIEKIAVGYEMNKQQSFVTFTPHWFMKYAGKWQKVWQ